MPDDIANAKRAMRADLRERRRQRSAKSLENDARGVHEQLDRLVADLNVTSMTCYLSSPTEPGTREFIAAAMERGIRILLPITRTDGLLDWAVADPEHDVAEGLFGVPEPVTEIRGPLALHDVDLLVIPAAAVDSAGTRLGWGRGFFDKTLGSMQKHPPVYAIVFDSELVDEVPRDVHDQPVDGVVTPTRIVSLPR